ncbi:MAG TPA: histidine phosphatase family protein [Thermoanaerobaculia bacterium]|nr:histidine phosphatase family protein [Thermoanaerobaculia bacterium]
MTAENHSGERFIVFLRHGTAEDPNGKSDAERNLTPEGHAEMKQISRGLEEVLSKADTVIASPLVRAQQTAVWVTKAYRLRVKVETSEALAPGASPDDFLALLAATPGRRVICVGHEPTLTNHMRALVRGTLANLGLQTGGAYGVRVSASGIAALEWVLTPKILRKLGEAD